MKMYKERKTVLFASLSGCQMTYLHRMEELYLYLILHYTHLVKILILAIPIPISPETNETGIPL